MLINILTISNGVIGWGREGKCSFSFIVNQSNIEKLILLSLMDKSLNLSAITAGRTIAFPYSFE